MEEQLYNKIKEHTVSAVRWIVLLFFLATSFLVVCLLSYFDVINVFKTSVSQLAVAVLLETGSIVGGFLILMPCYLDYRLIKNKTYLVRVVVVSRFDFYRSSCGESTEEIWFPVFEDVTSGRTLKIVIDDKVEVGERYFVACLPRTKIYALKKFKGSDCASSMV